MPLDQPLFIIKTQPVEKSLAVLLHRLELAHPQQLLLERANKPFRDAIAFRGADKRWTRRDAQEWACQVFCVTDCG